MKKYLFLFLFAASTAFAQTYPSPTGYVNDFAGVMSPQARDQLETAIQRFHEKTGVEIAVAALPDIGGMNIETYAVELFQRWGIGEKGKDNGLLFVIAVKERWLRLEVGYGLEPVINDGRAGEIRDKYMAPYLRTDDWDNGITQGVFAAMTYIAKDAGIDLAELLQGTAVPQSAPRGAEPQPDVPLPVVIFLVVLFLLLLRSRLFRNLLLAMFLANMFGGGRYRSGGFGGGFSGGGFGGGFGGFGGGRSRGGGAAGRF